jgi:hypothetical protein
VPFFNYKKSVNLTKGKPLSYQQQKPSTFLPNLNLNVFQNDNYFLRKIQKNTKYTKLHSKMMFQNIHKISYSHEEVSVNAGILTIFKCNFVISIFYQIKHLHFRYHVHTYELTDMSLHISSHQLSSTIQSFQCRHIFDDFRTTEINSSLFNEFVCKLGSLWHSRAFNCPTHEFICKLGSLLHEWASLKRE